LGFLGGSLTIVNDHMPVERLGPADAIGSILKGNLESGRLQNLAYLIAAFLKTELALQFVVVRLRPDRARILLWPGSSPQDRQVLAKFGKEAFCGSG
jgi:hypothetical protein